MTVKIMALKKENTGIEIILFCLDFFLHAVSQWQKERKGDMKEKIEEYFVF